MSSAFFRGFMLGAIIGVIVALFIAPQSGEETVAQLKDMGLTYKDRLEEGAIVAQEKGRQVVEQGRSVATDKFQQGRAKVTGQSSNGHAA